MTKPFTSQGAQMIVAERDRQQEIEGYHRAHDTLEHGDGELRQAATAYLLNASHWWPWPDAWKPEARPFESPTVKDLVRAGALIAAEIDRLLFAETVHRENARDAR